MNDRHMEGHNDGNATDEGFAMKQRRQSLRDKTCGLVGIGLSSVSSLGNGDFCYHWFLVATDLRLNVFAHLTPRLHRALIVASEQGIHHIHLFVHTF